MALVVHLNIKESYTGPDTKERKGEKKDPHLLGHKRANKEPLKCRRSNRRNDSPCTTGGTGG